MISELYRVPHYKCSIFLYCLFELQRAGDVGGQFERWTAAVSGGPQHSGGPQAGCSMLTYVLYFYSRRQGFGAGAFTLARLQLLV